MFRVDLITTTRDLVRFCFSAFLAEFYVSSTVGESTRRAHVNAEKKSNGVQPRNIEKERIQIEAQLINRSTNSNNNSKHYLTWLWRSNK
jgi:hypothetical protein